MRLRIVGHPRQQMRRRPVTEDDIRSALASYHTSRPGRDGAITYIGPGVNGDDLKVWVLPPGLTDPDTNRHQVCRVEGPGGSEMSIRIEVDTTLHAAYIELSTEPVVRTVAFSDDIQIDLDRFGVAVGIEVLDENARLPFDELLSEFHVRTDVIDLLKLIRPDVNSYLTLTTGNDGVSIARGPDPLVVR